MASIFDMILGRNQPQVSALAPGGAAPIVPMADPIVRPPSILNNADYGSNRLGDALGGMAQALIAAGAPSQYPRGFAEAFGAAGGGAVEGMKGSEEKYLKRALVDAQVQAAQESIKNDKAWRDMFNAPGTPAATATAGLPGAAAGPAVPGGGPSNPTNPGNITDGKGGFQTFPTPEAGVAAAIKNVQSYPAKYNGGQPMSLIQIGQAWAPKDDGKTPQLRGNDPVAWANNVARAGGLDPNQPLDFNDPQVALKFAQGVHVAEHGPQKAYAPDVYQRGVGLAFGGPPPPINPVGPVAAPPAQVATLPPFQTNGTGIPGIGMGTPPPQGGGEPSPVQTDGAPPPAATGGPVQLAQAPGAPAAPPIAPPQAGLVPPAAPQGGPRSLNEVIQTMPPGVRQMVGAMGRKEGMPIILKYADPETHVAIDTTTSQIVFAPKTDKSGRYVPVDVMKLDIERQNAASQAKQAAAREEANRIRGANEPMQPPATPGGAPTPTPGFAEQKGAIAGAEEGAKVSPKLLAYQGELAIKNHEQAQATASKARTDNNDINRLDQLLEGVQTGKGTALSQETKAWAKAAGFNLETLGVKDDVANTQAAQSLLNRMALEMRQTGDGAGMPGSMSDADRNFLSKIPPGLDTTPEGRKLIIGYMRWMNDRTIAIADKKNEFVQSDEFAKSPSKMYSEVKKFADSYPSYAEKNPLPNAPAAPADPVSAIDAALARKKAGANSLAVPQR